MERASAWQAQSAAQAAKNAAADLEKRTRTEKLKAEADAAAEVSALAEAEEFKRAAEADEAQKILDEASRNSKRDARYANRKAGN